MNASVNTITGEIEGHEVTAPDSALVQAINRAELDSAITTARAFPRSVKGFLNEARDLVTLNEEVAGACIYALPRDGKTIEGPSARFAEIMLHAWGNCRGGARVVAEEREFIVAQGVFHDLEKNVHVTFEVKRRITDRSGRRYKADMVGVTGNAACSIAIRNAVLKGIPKAMWDQLYKEARKIVVGDAKTLANRRADALARLQKIGATPAMVLATLALKGIEDIGLDELAALQGIFNSIKEGETTVEQAFAPTEAPADAPAGRAAQAKAALRPVASAAAEVIIPHYSEALALKELRACQTEDALKAKWHAVRKDFQDSGRPLPVGVEAVYNETSEALAAQDESL